MAESSNPTTTEAKVQPVNRFLKKGALTFGACLALADEVFAQQGGGSPVRRQSKHSKRPLPVRSPRVWHWSPSLWAA